MHEFSVENETLVCDKILHAAVVGTYAYVVISATLSLKLKTGQSASRQGVLTLTFAKQGDTWAIEAQAWARLS